LPDLLLRIARPSSGLRLCLHLAYHTVQTAVHCGHSRRVIRFYTSPHVWSAKPSKQRLAAIGSIAWSPSTSPQNGSPLRSASPSDPLPRVTELSFGFRFDFRVASHTTQMAAHNNRLRSVIRYCEYPNRAMVFNSARMQFAKPVKRQLTAIHSVAWSVGELPDRSPVFD
jgi:hypothetical protein